MDKEQIDVHGKVMAWFIENPEKGVWFRKWSGAAWIHFFEPSFHQIEGLYIINDEHAEERKKAADAFTKFKEPEGMTKDEEIEQLRTQLKEYQMKENVYWEPSEKDTGFFINAYGDVRQGFDSKPDMDKMKQIGCIFETIGEADKAVQLLKAKAKVKKWVYQLNGNQWVPRGSEGVSVHFSCGSFYMVDSKFAYSWLILGNAQSYQKLIKELPDELQLILEE